MAHCLKSGTMSKVPFRPLPIRRQKLSRRFNQSGSLNTAMDNIPKNAAQAGYRNTKRTAILFEASGMCGQMLYVGQTLRRYANQVAGK